MTVNPKRKERSAKNSKKNEGFRRCAKLSKPSSAAHIGSPDFVQVGAFIFRPVIFSTQAYLQGEADGSFTFSPDSSCANSKFAELPSMATLDIFPPGALPLANAEITTSLFGQSPIRIA